MARTNKTPAERLKQQYRKRPEKRTQPPPPLNKSVTVIGENGEAVVKNNLTIGKEYEERISDFVAQHIAEHKIMPNASAISEALGISIKTVSKHLTKIIDPSMIKRMAKNLTGHVVAQHYNLIMNDEKASAGLIKEWYDHFGPEKEQSSAIQTGNAKITINIVGVSPAEVEAEDAEVIE